MVESEADRRGAAPAGSGRRRRWSPPTIGAGRQTGIERKRSKAPVDRSRVEVDAAVDGDEDDGEHERARAAGTASSAGGAGQRSAEQVGEHQREQARGPDDVGELLRDALDLQHRPPGERERRRECARLRRTRARRNRLAVGASSPSPGVRGSLVRLPRSSPSCRGCRIRRGFRSRQGTPRRGRPAEREVDGDPSGRESGECVVRDAGR